MLFLPTAGQSQQPADSLPKPRRGSETVIPIASWFVPGLGQYLHGAHRAGLAYIGAFLGGSAVGLSRDVPDSLELSRDPADQLSDMGWSVAMSAAWLSSWDAFHRAVPAHQRLGKYAFLPRRESVGQLVTAPFDFRFLKRWTTWVDLAQTAAITTLILSETGSRHWSDFRGHDAFYSGTVSLNAAVGEEAFFRGYMLPMLHEKTLKNFWYANTAQAAIFGGLHAGQSGWYAGVIGAWALWEGWVTRRNDWSIRESIFHHFWYDAIIISAAMIVDGAPDRRIRRVGLGRIPF